MSRPTIAAVGVLIAAMVVVAWSAWTWWPPVLKYRLRHIDQRTDHIILDYLDGKRALGPSARALADLWKAKMAVSEHMPPVGQTARIVDPGPGALGPRVNDPRLKELVDSAVHLSALWFTRRMDHAGRDST